MTLEDTRASILAELGSDPESFEYKLTSVLLDRVISELAGRDGEPAPAEIVHMTLCDAIGSLADKLRYRASPSLTLEAIHDGDGGDGDSRGRVVGALIERHGKRITLDAKALNIATFFFSELKKTLLDQERDEKRTTWCQERDAKRKTEAAKPKAPSKTKK